MRCPSRLAAITVAVAAVAALSGCSDGKSAVAPPGAGPGAIAFTVSGDEVAAAAAPGPRFPDDVRAKVTATLERYLGDAVVGPLRSGRPAGDLGTVFTGPALARINGPDRAALVDEGLPPADDLRADAASARLAALAEASGVVTVVAAGVEIRLRTGGPDDVTIVRTGDLVLVADGDGWKIDGYEIRTTRDSAGGEATTTTARG